MKLKLKSKGESVYIFVSVPNIFSHGAQNYYQHLLFHRFLLLRACQVVFCLRQFKRNITAP